MSRLIVINRNITNARVKKISNPKAGVPIEGYIFVKMNNPIKYISRRNNVLLNKI
jgi:hypothetical protein